MVETISFVGIYRGQWLKPYCLWESSETVGFLCRWCARNEEFGEVRSETVPSSPQSGVRRALAPVPEAELRPPRPAQGAVRRRVRWRPTGRLVDWSAPGCFASPPHFFFPLGFLLANPLEPPAQRVGQSWLWVKIGLFARHKALSLLRWPPPRLLFRCQLWPTLPN